jgi:hypothetical protein
VIVRVVVLVAWQLTLVKVLPPALLDDTRSTSEPVDLDNDERAGETKILQARSVTCICIRAPCAIQLIVTYLNQVRDALVLDSILMEPVSLERKVGAVLDLGAPLVPEDDRVVLARQASLREPLDQLIRAYLAVVDPLAREQLREILRRLNGHRFDHGASQITRRYRRRAGRFPFQPDIALPRPILSVDPAPSALAHCGLDADCGW